MEIIRFIDEQNQTVHGHHYKDGVAVALKGSLAEGFTDTGQECRVIKLLAPLEPSAILGIGLNYHDHAKETGMPSPEHPILFMKNPASLHHPDDPIVLPPSCMDPLQVDYEAELAVVIGQKVKDVSVDEALGSVLGYTAANDVSARRWQKLGGGGQWVRGKSFDTFCPLGPVLVTADEIPDPQRLEVQCRLNGQVMQDGSTADMIFSVARLIAFLSEGMTLLPGTVILTGTPKGVGMARKPEVYLKPGDQIAVTISGIGTLTNPVVAGDR
ncbi:MAG: fumarylacetoacetate hydrolase family protein [bacterium]|nr:fumarylacetoacetate hydrolase family protein [bacterium]